MKKWNDLISDWLRKVSLQAIESSDLVGNIDDSFSNRFISIHINNQFIYQNIKLFNFSPCFMILPQCWTSVKLISIFQRISTLLILNLIVLSNITILLLNNGKRLHSFRGVEKTKKWKECSAYSPIQVSGPFLWTLAPCGKQLVSQF